MRNQIGNNKSILPFTVVPFVLEQIHMHSYIINSRLSHSNMFITTKK